MSKYEWNQVGAGTMISGLAQPTPWAPKLADCASSEEYDALYWAPGEPESVLGEEWEYVPPPFGYLVAWTVEREKEWLWVYWRKLADDLYAEQ